MAEAHKYHDYFTIEADKRSGQVCIRGLRLTVHDVMSYLETMSPEAILDDFPLLSAKDIAACENFSETAWRIWQKETQQPIAKFDFLQSNAFTTTAQALLQNPSG